MRSITPFIVLLLGAGVPTVADQGRRVVDVVKVGDPSSEREHEYAGENVTEGVADGRPFRQARGWLRYSLKVYEDSEVTLACTFRGSEGRKHVFDLLVEGRRIGTHTFVSPSSAPVNVEFRVPLTVTAGLTGISVMLRPADGVTPGVIELRTVQEHLEHPLRGQILRPRMLHGLTPAARGQTVQKVRLQNLTPL